MPSLMHSLAENHARNIGSKFTAALYSCADQVNNYLAHAATGNDPKRAGEKARDALKNTLRDLGRDFGRAMEAEVGSLKNYQMITTDPARRILNAHRRTADDIIAKIESLVGSCVLQDDPAKNGAIVKDLGKKVGDLARQFEQAAFQVLSDLRR